MHSDFNDSLDFTETIYQNEGRKGTKMRDQKLSLP